MTYTINNIIKNNSLIIKLLTYETNRISDLNLDILDEEELIRFNSFLAEKRKLEFYFTRVLLKSISISYSVKYKPSGKPIINDGHISISHSKNHIVIAISKKMTIGIDIEFFNPKIERIKHKYLSEYEKVNFNTEDLKILTLIWSIKEAVYKLEDIHGLRFKEDIIVRSIKEIGELEVRKNGTSHNYEYRKIISPNYLITYCYLDK